MQYQVVFLLRGGGGGFVPPDTRQVRVKQHSESNHSRKAKEQLRMLSHDRLWHKCTPGA